MTVLAIGYLTGKDIPPHIAAEQRSVAEVREQGFIHQVFLEADRTGPVLLPNNTDRARRGTGPPRAVRDPTCR